MLLQQDGGSSRWFGPGTLKYSRQLPSQPAHFKKTGVKPKLWTQTEAAHEIEKSLSSNNTELSGNSSHAMCQKWNLHSERKYDHIGMREIPHGVARVIPSCGLKWQGAGHQLVIRMGVCGSKIWIPVRSTPLQTSTVSGLTRSGSSPNGESGILNRWWTLLFFPLHGDYRISIKIFGLGSNLQHFFFFQKPTVAQMTICYLVIIVCLNPYAPLLILAGCCWFVNLLIDGSAICNASSLLMLSEHAARSFSAASHLSLWVTSFYGLQTRPIFYINFKIFIPSSDKSTFMPHVSVLFCSEPTTIMTLAMVYVSSGGFSCVRAPNWPTWSTGQAGIRLGLEKVKSSLRKFQKHRDCCVSWQKGGAKKGKRLS